MFLFRVFLEKLCCQIVLTQSLQKTKQTADLGAVNADKVALESDTYIFGDVTNKIGLTLKVQIFSLAWKPGFSTIFPWDNLATFKNLVLKKVDLFDWWEANPFLIGNALAMRHNSEGQGFNSRCEQRILSRAISVRVYLHLHLVVDIAHHVSVSCTMH